MSHVCDFHQRTRLTLHAAHSCTRERARSASPREGLGVLYSITLLPWRYLQERNAAFHEVPLV